MSATEREDAAGRLPPQDLDAEQSVLGAMLLSEAAVSEATEVLKAEDFYRGGHGEIDELHYISSMAVEALIGVAQCLCLFGGITPGERRQYFAVYSGKEHAPRLSGRLERISHRSDRKLFVPELLTLIEVLAQPRQTFRQLRASLGVGVLHLQDHKVRLDGVRGRRQNICHEILATYDPVVQRAVHLHGGR